MTIHPEAIVAGIIAGIAQWAFIYCRKQLRAKDHKIGKLERALEKARDARDHAQTQLRLYKEKWEDKRSLLRLPKGAYLSFSSYDAKAKPEVRCMVTIKRRGLSPFEFHGTGSCWKEARDNALKWVPRA